MALANGMGQATGHNLTPHVLVAQASPSHLPPNGGSWDQDDWDSYADYTYNFVKYVALHNPGKLDSLIEVGGEVEVFTTYWYIEGTHGHGSTAMFNAYAAVYAVWAAAV